MQNNNHKGCISAINFLVPQLRFILFFSMFFLLSYESSDLLRAFLSFPISFLPSFRFTDLSGFLSCISFAGNLYICDGKYSPRNIGRRWHHTCTDDGDIGPATSSRKLVLKLKEKIIKSYCSYYFRGKISALQINVYETNFQLTAFPSLS